MLTDTLSKIFERDLKKLLLEIELYKKEENLWIVDKQIANSAGNLALHLIGNLNTYIGKEIGHTDYVRNRALEFSQKNVPRSELVAKIKDTITVVTASLKLVTLAQLEETFPVVVISEGPSSTEYFLVHLATHLSYHLGQVNYHRRLLDE